jgi:hypothetical protein
MTERRIRLPGETPRKPKKQPKYVIVRTRSAGVFAGIIVTRKNQSVVMTDARRLWYWAGAASLSQLAVEGTKTPKNCKFPVAVDKIELFEVIEILETSLQAEESIRGVAIWSA